MVSAHSTTTKKRFCWRYILPNIQFKQLFFEKKPDGENTNPPHVKSVIFILINYTLNEKTRPVSTPPHVKSAIKLILKKKQRVFKHNFQFYKNLCKILFFYMKIKILQRTNRCTKFFKIYIYFNFFLSALYKNF